MTRRTRPARFQVTASQEGQLGAAGVATRRDRDTVTLTADSEAQPRLSSAHRGCRSRQSRSRCPSLSSRWQA